MLSIPSALQAQFEECLQNKAIPKKRMGRSNRGRCQFIQYIYRHHLSRASASNPPSRSTLEEAA